METDNVNKWGRTGSRWRPLNLPLHRTDERCRWTKTSEDFNVAHVNTDISSASLTFLHCSESDRLSSCQQQHGSRDVCVLCAQYHHRPPKLQRWAGHTHVTGRLRSPLRPRSGQRRPLCSRRDGDALKWKVTSRSRTLPMYAVCSQLWGF